MSEACPKCPCPDICLRREIWCQWAADKLADSVEVRSICDRSRLAKDPDRIATGRPEPIDDIRPSVIESLVLTRRMTACLHRTKLPGCCTAAMCELGGKVVSHVDCFTCLEAGL